MDYPEELELLRRYGADLVDVDHYLERGLRASSEHMTLDEYEKLQRDHDHGKHHCDSFTVIVNVITDGCVGQPEVLAAGEAMEAEPAEAFFLQCRYRDQHGFYSHLA